MKDNILSFEISDSPKPGCEYTQSGFDAQMDGYDMSGLQELVDAVKSIPPLCFEDPDQEYICAVPKGFDPSAIGLINLYRNVDVVEVPYLEEEGVIYFIPAVAEPKKIFKHYWNDKR